MWSHIKVDGKLIGDSPKRNIQLPVGTHTAVFDCGECDPADSRTKTFEVVEDAPVTVIVSF